MKRNTGLRSRFTSIRAAKNYQQHHADRQGLCHVHPRFRLRFIRVSLAVVPRG